MNYSNIYTSSIYNIIQSELTKLITGDYIYLGVPHYTSNVGDILLWETTLNVLHNIKHRCLYESSIRSYEKPVLSTNTIIVIHPGGNFGDIWREHQEFRHRVLTDFPYNPIVQLPQSVWFDSNNYLMQDIELFKKHKAPVTICLRERQSYNIISQHYPFVKAVLLPDFALSFDIDKYCRRHIIKRTQGNGALLLLRKDVEFKKQSNIDQLKKINVVSSDWPCMEKPILIETIVKKILYASRRLGKRFQNRLTAFCYKSILRHIYIRYGIKFIDKYQTLYSTRLHAAIIATLLGKEVHLFDNSYGKCRSVYETWMKELPNIRFDVSK